MGPRQKRLYNVMLNAFNESTHYLCADSFTSRDGIAIYQRMHKHFYGHTEATSTDSGAFYRASRALRLLVLKRIWSSLQRR